MVRLIGLALVPLVLFAWTPTAWACSCDRAPVAMALVHAPFVAEVEILDVLPPLDSDHLGQSLRVRVVRVFKGPRGVSDGDELTILHFTCTSEPYDRDDVGSRFIGFFDIRRGRVQFHFCSTTWSAHGPLPGVLRYARTQWLEGRR